MGKAWAGLVFLFIFVSLFSFFFKGIVGLISIKCEDINPRESLTLVWVLLILNSGKKGHWYIFTSVGPS